MRIKPAPGKVIHNPVSKLDLPEEGIEISQMTSYWYRRLQDGDVVEVKESAPAPVSEKKSKKEKVGE